MNKEMTSITRYNNRQELKEWSRITAWWVMVGSIVYLILSAG